MKLPALVFSSLFLLLPSAFAHPHVIVERTMKGGPCHNLTASECETERALFKAGPCEGFDFWECENFDAIQFEESQP